jgi:hypothetical protein
MLGRSRPLVFWVRLSVPLDLITRVREGRFRVSPALALEESTVDDICACPDRQCVEEALALMREIMTQNAKNPDWSSLRDAAEAARFRAARARLWGCTYRFGAE